MRKLLDNSTRRRLELLEYLSSNFKWVSSNELAIKLDASLRTINSDIQYLKENWYPYITIETSKKNGVRLTTPSNSHIQLIYQKIIKHSDNFLLLEKMFFYPTKNLEDWENDLYSSYSSLYRTSQLIDEVISKHQLELKKAPFHISNKNEVKVRYFFVNYFHQVYFIRTWPFEVDRQIVTSLAVDIAEEFFGVNYREIDDMMVVYLGYIIAISLTRQSQGFWVDPSEFTPSLEKYLPIVIGKNEQLKTLASLFKLDFNEALSKDLVLSIYLFQKDTISDNQWEELSLGIESFIDCLEKILHVHANEKDHYVLQRTFKAIFLHHKTFPNREDILFNRYEYNAHLIMTNYPIYSKCIKLGLKQLEDQTNFPWFSQYYEHLVYWIMIKWYNLAILIDQKKRKANILVLNDHGKDHTLFLANLLKHNFSNKSVITPYTGEMFSIESLDVINWEAYDIVISNFFSQVIPEEKLILLNSFPSNEEWAKIRNAINNAHQSALEFLHSTLDENEAFNQSTINETSING